MNKFLLTGSIFLLPGFVEANESELEHRRPNILFCIADDAGHMGAYGHHWLNTPAFDAIAHEGILFSNMFTCNAKSAPSRATFLTGRNSWQLEEACNHWPQFPPKFRTLPEALSLLGYEVGCTGKGWGPGIANDSLGRPREMTGKMWNSRTKQPPATGICNIDYAANFEDFMKQRAPGKPFCFWYGAKEPHRGYEFNSSKRFGKKIEDIDRVPPYWPDHVTIRTDMLDYAVEVEHFDHHLGRILKILEEQGELDNTLVIVTSDHGMPFPRCKGQTYYDSNHIPMAVMWRDRLQSPGRVVDDLISSIDVVPTLLDAIGIPQSSTGMQPVTGRSFMDLVDDKKSKDIDRGYVLLGKERHDTGRPYDWGYPIRAIVRDGFLYIRNFEPTRWPAGNPEMGYQNVDASPSKTVVLDSRRKDHVWEYWQYSFGKRGEEELYDIQSDPYCIHDLAKEKAYAKTKKKLNQEMMQRLRAEGDPRVYGQGKIFDEYPYKGRSHNYWEKMKKGQKVIAPCTRPTDFDRDLEEN